jgi:hypothetical protein
MAALIIMALVPELFEPQQVENKHGQVEPWHWPKTISLDRRDAKFHAKSLLQLMPDVLDIVHANMRRIASPQCRRELLRNSQYRFCAAPL